MTKIKFKLVDGEPVCDSKNCPRYETCIEIGDKDECIPGLRQQRDEAQADLAEARAVIERVRAWTGPYRDVIIADLYERGYKAAQDAARATLLSCVPEKPATEGGEG